MVRAHSNPLFYHHSCPTRPRLLGVDPSRLNAATLSSSSKQETHRDEYQIKLDTTRSFVLYPHNPSDHQRGQLQTDLHELIVALFRKRPKLNYFQGYHDIVSVLFLTLPKQLQLPCVEKLSLHRLRDSMGVGLEPVLGLLRCAVVLSSISTRKTDDLRAQCYEETD